MVAAPLLDRHRVPRSRVSGRSGEVITQPAGGPDGLPPGGLPCGGLPPGGLPWGGLAAGSATSEIDVVPQVRPAPRSRRTIRARGSSGLRPSPFISGHQAPQACATGSPGRGMGRGAACSRARKWWTRGRVGSLSLISRAACWRAPAGLSPPAPGPALASPALASPPFTRTCRPGGRASSISRTPSQLHRTASAGPTLSRWNGSNPVFCRRSACLPATRSGSTSGVRRDPAGAIRPHPFSTQATRPAAGASASQVPPACWSRPPISPG